MADTPENEYKKNVLHGRLQIKGIHERINLMEKENKAFIARNEEIGEVIAEQKDGYEDTIGRLSHQLDTTVEEKLFNQINLEKANQQLIQLEEDNQTKLQDMVREFE